MGRKKKTEIKNEKTETFDTDEQMDLMDVQPENAQEIIEAVKKYKKFQGARIKAGIKEVELKGIVKNLVKAAKLQPLEDGVTKLRFNHVEISITPRDEIIKIKYDDEEFAEE